MKAPDLRPLAPNGSRRKRGAVRAPSVTDDAIDKIRERIVSGAWGPGDRLPKESELAAELGLSRNSLREAVRALWDAKWDLGLPLLIIVAVASGFATIVESAALGGAYAIIAEILVHRDVHPTRDLPRVLVHASTLVGSVLILLGVALGMTSYLVDAEIPTRLLAWVQAHIHSQWEFLLALNVLLLVLGSVLEIYSAIVVLAPLVAPLGIAFGVEPVHLGVVFLANLELGFLFPPMGLNLFLSASRFNKPLPVLYRKALPFLIIMSIGVLLITYVPAITTGMVASTRLSRYFAIFKA